MGVAYTGKGIFVFLFLKIQYLLYHAQANEHDLCLP